MVKRVLIRGGGGGIAMRVSLPGYDVMTAGLTQTCFDDRWSGLVQYRTGTVDAPISTTGVNVSFGETLDVPPMFMGYARPINNGQLAAPTDSATGTYYFWNNNADPVWMYVACYVDRMFFRAAGIGGVQGYRLYYTLFKRPAG